MKSVPDEIRLCRVLDGFNFICKADFIRVYTDFIVSKASDFIRVRERCRFDDYSLTDRLPLGDPEVFYWKQFRVDLEKEEK